MLGLLSLYLVFVGTVVAFGVLAFYTGHKTTQEVAFFGTAILFLILPIGALWYLLPIFIKKDTLGRLLKRINQSSISKSLARLGKDRRVRLINLALYAFMICIEIRQFPLHPRFSLAMVVLYMALSFVYLIPWVSESIKREIYIEIYRETGEVYKSILSVLKIIEGVRDHSMLVLRIAEGSHKSIEGTEESHSEAHKTTVAAIRAINDALQLVATTGVRGPVDTPSKGPEGVKAEGDEEPNEP